MIFTLIVTYMYLYTVSHKGCSMSFSQAFSVWPCHYNRWRQNFTIRLTHAWNFAHVHRGYSSLVLFIFLLSSPVLLHIYSPGSCRFLVLPFLHFSTLVFYSVMHREQCYFISIHLHVVIITLSCISCIVENISTVHTVLWTLLEYLHCDDIGIA